MEHYKYLIIGGGMTAHAAIEGIRSVDPDGEIGLTVAKRIGPTIARLFRKHSGRESRLTAFGVNPPANMSRSI